MALEHSTIDISEAAASVGGLVVMLHNGEMTAPQGVIDRLEGAFLALTALAEGRCPTVEELFGTRG
jgi:hypothetical protein